MTASREPTDFGWWLLQAMAGHQPPLTQADLARLAGVSQSTVSRWIHDPVRPDTATLRRLATALGVPHGELLHRAGHGTPTSPTTSRAGIIDRITTVLANATPERRRQLEAVLDAVISADEHPGPASRTA